MTDEFEQKCRLLYEMELKDSPIRLEYLAIPDDSSGSPIKERYV